MCVSEGGRQKEGQEQELRMWKKRGGTCADNTVVQAADNTGTTAQKKDNATEQTAHGTTEQKQRFSDMSRPEKRDRAELEAERYS